MSHLMNFETGSSHCKTGRTGAVQRSWHRFLLVEGILCFSCHQRFLLPFVRAFPQPTSSHLCPVVLLKLASSPSKTLPSGQRLARTMYKPGDHGEFHDEPHPFPFWGPELGPVPPTSLMFRGGAIVHGPKPRNYEYGLPKQVRRLGLKVALSARLAEGKLIIFDSIIPPTLKTKDMAQVLDGLEQRKRILFVDEFDKVNESFCRATSNLYGANVLPVKGLTVYSILQHDTLIMTIGAVRSLEQRLHTPINR